MIVFSSFEGPIGSFLGNTVTASIDLCILFKILVENQKRKGNIPVIVSDSHPNYVKPISTDALGAVGFLPTMTIDNSVDVILKKIPDKKSDMPPSKRFNNITMEIFFLF